ncbi:MAG: galactokinase, partial [Stomatobaculum sp.]|nr:galactokinase [Stomatobaculum sp.]
MREIVLGKFHEVFGPEGDIRTYFAPGRVNLIGEHTDYNGGHVFPCALTVGTYAAARKRTDRKLRFYSVNFEHLGVIESSLDDMRPLADKGWTGYPKGVVWAFEKRGMKLSSGFDFVVYGDIPNGSGLSSSAAIEVLTGEAVRDLYGFENATNQDLALIGQDSENNYNGMNCGIMDQFASAMGKKDSAVFLDTADLSFEYVPIVLEGKKIIITNTNKKHKLTDSQYNARRSACEAALAELQTVVDIKALGELSAEEFEKYKGAIKDPDRQRKAKHAVYENIRTLEAVKALKAGELERFGKL